MNAEWPSYPVLRILREEDEPLRVFLIDLVRKNWSTVEKIAQFLYDHSFSEGFHRDGPTVQVRFALPLKDLTGEKRFFSAFLQWGAPMEAWGDENFANNEEPWATIEIYEAEGTGWLREVARSVILHKDLHVKVHVAKL